VAGESQGNPYAAPTGNLQHAFMPRAAAREPALFSMRQLLFSTVFGTLFAGVFVLWPNYRAMGEIARARRALVLGLPVAGTWFALMLVLPQRIPGSFINLALGLFFYGFCNAVQGPAVFRRLRAGGRQISNWIAIALIVGAWLTVSIALLLAVSAMTIRV